jgi:hypothetical protein
MDTLDTLQTLPTGSGWDQFWIIAAVFVAIYEVVIRFIPTVADFTILGFIYRVLDMIVENRAVNKGATQAEKGAKPVFRIFRIFKKK